MTVLSNLRSTLYSPGSVIIPFFTDVNEMVIISEGKCNLFGLFSQSEEEQRKVKLVSLPEGSWFGDF